MDIHLFIPQSLSKYTALVSEGSPSYEEKDAEEQQGDQKSLPLILLTLLSRVEKPATGGGGGGQAAALLSARKYIPEYIVEKPCLGIYPFPIWTMVAQRRKSRGTGKFRLFRLLILRLRCPRRNFICFFTLHVQLYSCSIRTGLGPGGLM
jgi:hypothetical protein